MDESGDFWRSVTTEMTVRHNKRELAPPAAFQSVLAVAAAVVCTSLGISLHQTSDLGVAPYDYLALGLRDHTPLPYFCCRLFTDTLCALLAFMLGGLLGLGTLICAFCLGPLIQFFNTHVSENVLQYVPTGQQA